MKHKAFEDTYNLRRVFEYVGDVQGDTATAHCFAEVTSNRRAAIRECREDSLAWKALKGSSVCTSSHKQKDAKQRSSHRSNSKYTTRFMLRIHAADVVSGWGSSTNSDVHWHTQESMQLPSLVPRLSSIRRWQMQKNDIWVTARAEEKPAQCYNYCSSPAQTRELWCVHLLHLTPCWSCILSIDILEPLVMYWIDDTKQGWWPGLLSQRHSSLLGPVIMKLEW